MNAAVQAFWTTKGAVILENQTAMQSHVGPGRLEKLTEDTLTPEAARELDERMQNPPLLPGRPARRVRVGEGQFLFQTA